MAGPEKGKIFPFNEVGNGIGWDATFGIAGTEFYYSGPASSFSVITHLSGTSYMLSGGGTIFGVDFGTGVGYAKTSDDYNIYMLGINIGFTGSPVNVSGSLFKNTTIFDDK